MNRANSPYGLISAAAFAFGSIATPISAQITPDATLSNNSVVLPNGNVLTIEGGTESGMNLFHSFEEFSIPTGSEAFFNNAIRIDNIITRVTGGNLSNIDGLIRANGTANLFLTNPNGIQFGPNARLEIGGSFFGSTAESVLFEDGSFYSATEPNEPSLLTINVPIGLQYGSSPGDILIRGMGTSITRRPFAPFDRSLSEGGLRVSVGNTLALVGGGITVEGGTLTAESGRIELGGVADGTVGLVSSPGGWNLDYAGVSGFQDIQLTQAAALDASGVRGGSIALHGDRVQMADGSLILIQNLGFQPAGAIDINAAESLELFVSGPQSGLTDNRATNWIASETLATGNGGDITISTGQFVVRDGGLIISNNFGSGSSGDITVNASESVQLEGAFGFLAPSFITASVQGSGRGGDVILSTRELVAKDGGGVTSTVFGDGDGGDLTIVASESIEVRGVIANIPSTESVLASNTFGAGDAGTLTIETRRLSVLDGANVGGSSFATGAAGSTLVNASESVEVSGMAIDFPANVSGLSSSVPIRSAAFRETFRLPDVPTGQSGNVIVNTPLLQVRDGAEVSVLNDGPGNGGKLAIDASTISLNDGGSITAATASGEGGNIVLEVENSLQLSNSSQISAEANGTGNGGNMEINASTIALLDNSSINANAFEGAGGNIQITSLGLFVAPDSRITASSELGVDGTVAVNNPIDDRASGLVTLDGDTLNPNTQIQDSCDIATRSRFTFAGSGGLPEDPTELFRGRTVWRDTRLREIQSHLTPNSTEVLLEESAAPPAPLVEATGWRTNRHGQIELIVPSGNPSHSSWQPHPECESLSQH